MSANIFATYFTSFCLECRLYLPQNYLFHIGLLPQNDGLLKGNSIKYKTFIATFKKIIFFALNVVFSTYLMTSYHRAHLYVSLCLCLFVCVFFSSFSLCVCLPVFLLGYLSLSICLLVAVLCPRFLNILSLLVWKFSTRNPVAK